MKHEHKYKRRITFAETDMAGITHFSNLFRLAEEAEHDFFRSIGHSIQEKHDDKVTGWPRVHASCDFSKPVYFEEELTVHLIVEEMRSSSITYQFIIYKEDQSEAARGKITSVCVQFDEKTKIMKAAIIPDSIREKIGPKGK